MIFKTTSRYCLLVWSVVTVALVGFQPAQNCAHGANAQFDIPYASAPAPRGPDPQNPPDTTLKLDFYPSDHEGLSPLIVWVHGGAWRSGDKRNVPIKPLTRHGFSIASLNYRLSGTARFPAQPQDIKAGIRFLRANAERFQIDANRVVIAGASAGGHLAALVGVSNRVDSLEDFAMGNADVSSAVSAIVSLYGASNLETILSQSTPHGLSVREPALRLLLGDLPPAVPELAKLASPVTHVDADDPPMLLIHGDQDPQMPINQSHELEGAYQRAGLDVTFQVLHGAAHGGKVFYEEEQLNRMSKWIGDQLK